MIALLSDSHNSDYDDDYDDDANQSAPNSMIIIDTISFKLI